MRIRTLTGDILANAGRFILNLGRLLPGPRPDYVVLELQGSYPERRERRSPLQRLPFPKRERTIQEFADQLDLIAGDPTVKGIILRFRELKVGMATLQNLREALGWFRQKGKRVIAFLPLLDTRNYYLASAADEVITVESAHFDVRGLSLEVTFLKDALASYGIQGDIEAIAEYKTTADIFRRSEMSEAHREMLEAILDSYYGDILSGIAEGRGLERDRVAEIIDEAPLLAEQAVEEGLVNALLYEDELAGHLGSPADGEAILQPWVRARRRLRRPYRWRDRRAIGVVSLRGIIMAGESRELPLPIPLLAVQAGSETIARALRRAEQDKGIAAVIFHVDSRGGSALASDLIWREVKRLRQRKPVVAYMGNVAGSGGYYVTAPADRIVAQSATLTGSIGVIGGKFVLRGLYEKLKAKREILQRGRGATLYSDARPFTDEERAKIQELMADAYERFKARVAEGRGLTLQEVEGVARGRVWTGRQALERGLVDELGDFQRAVEIAKELAGIPVTRTVPVVPIAPPRRFTLPATFGQGEALLNLVVDSVTGLLKERVFALMPWEIRVL